MKITKFERNPRGVPLTHAPRASIAPSMSTHLYAMTQILWLTGRGWHLRA